jgi:hypothetical protein
MAKKKKEEIIEAAEVKTVKLAPYQAWRRGLITKERYESLIFKRRSQITIDVPLSAE